MDFLRNTADEDIPMDKGELNIAVEGGDIMIAFTGQAITGKATSGIYGGPIIRLD